MIYDRDNKITDKVESILRKSKRGLVSNLRLIITKKIFPKLRNIFSTRRTLHIKMKQFGEF